VRHDPIGVSLGMSADDLRSDKKSTPWEIALAAEMKSRTTASNPWLASACRANPQEYAPYKRRMAKCKV